MQLLTIRTVNKRLIMPQVPFSFYASFERPLNSHDKVQKHPLKNVLCILCLQFQWAKSPNLCEYKCETNCQIPIIYAFVGNWKRRWTRYLWAKKYKTIKATLEIVYKISLMFTKFMMYLINCTRWWIYFKI